MGLAPSTASSTSGAVLSSRHFPVKSFVRFEKLGFEPILKKLKQLNDQVSEKVFLFYLCSHDQAKLSLDQLSQLDNLTKILSNTSFYHSSTPSLSSLDVIAFIFTTWPEESKFPGFHFLS